MAVNLIGPDIKLMRDRYDQALSMMGIPATYQYPNLPDSNNQGETLVDSFSDPISTHVFFEGNPKVKTYKRLGWVVANDENLPFLIHCSFHLPHLQKDAIFTLSGQYTGLSDNIFRVKELTSDMQAPDHIICQIIPVYDKEHVGGMTKTEVANTYNKSNTFLKQDVDYRGKYYKPEEMNEQ